MREPHLAPAEIHAQFKFGFSGRNEPRTAVANTQAPADKLTLITDALLNVGFVSSVSSLHSPFPSETSWCFMEVGLVLKSWAWALSAEHTQDPLSWGNFDAAWGFPQSRLSFSLYEGLLSMEMHLLACNDFSCWALHQDNKCALISRCKGWEEGKGFFFFFTVDFFPPRF